MEHTLALSGNVSVGRRVTRMSSEGLQDVAGPFVLVVEDYPDAREMYSEYLRFSGFRVAEARNGEEALEKAFTLRPDVILMDLALPLMDGWEATRRLKSDPRTSQILVVALTGHALAGHQEGARRAGCDSFVTKPCLPDELVDEIRRLLANRDGTEVNGASAQAMGAGAATEATAVPATVPVVSQAKAVFNPS
jgi:two-component system cell cycle response regulator DivK